MEDILSKLENLDFTLEIEDLLIEEHDSYDLALVAHVVTEHFINSDALFRARKDGLEFKVLNRTTFIFYFEVVEDVEHALYKSP